MTAHICSYLSAAAARCDGRPMFTCGSRTETAKQAAGCVAALAVGLAQRLGAQAGDCVCLAALATDHNLQALLAVTAAGCIAAPLNWRWSAAEGAHAARLVDAKLLLTDAACLEFALGVAAASGCVRALLLLGEPADYRASAGAGGSLERAGVPFFFAETLVSECPNASLQLRCAPGGAALVVYTSGTTGRPKGVTLSHAAVHVQSMAKLLVVGYRRGDVYLHAAPLFHIGGLSSALAMLMAGAAHVFLPRFEPEGFLGAVRSHGVTSFIAVPAMVAALVDAAGAGGAAGRPTLETVRTILLGGGGTPPAVHAGVRALFPRAAVHTAYGMTEACSSMTFLTLWAPDGSASAPGSGSTASCSTYHSSALECAREGDGGSSSGGAGGGPAGEEEGAATGGGVFVGSPPPGIELALLCGPRGAQPLRPAAALPSGAPGGGGAAWGCVSHEGEGEVVTRGPHVMLGYWQDEEATQAAFLPGGWMRTGDLGCMRQGRLWLLGRSKDMIKSGGENVHAWEVERALGEHPAVQGVAVVGVSDWRLGEAVAAVLVLRQGWAWRGPPCQVLLQTARAQAAAVSAAAAAGGDGGTALAAGGKVPAQAAAREAAAEAALGALAGAAGEGDGGLSEAEEAAARQEKLQAAAAEVQQPWLGLGGGQRGGAAGLLAALEELSERRQPRSSPDLLHLRRVATGLLQLSALGGDGEGAGNAIGAGAPGAASGGGTPDGTSGAAQWVDGLQLQRHCRAAGLAGFKLPRVFLALPAGEALPANSSGKVLKHLVRARVGREAQQAQLGARAKL